MIKIYTVSSCTSCKKAKTWLNAHQLSYKEQNLGKEGITREELLDILTKTDNGIASIVSSKNRYAKALGVDIEDLSVNEVLNLIMETPRILKTPTWPTNRYSPSKLSCKTTDSIRAFSLN